MSMRHSRIAAIEPSTYLGMYQGWVGSTVEAAHGLCEDCPVQGGADSAFGVLPSVERILERATAEQHRHSYVADLVTVSGHPCKDFIVSPVHPRGGRHVGNALTRINDGSASPFSEMPPLPEGDGPLGGDPRGEPGSDQHSAYPLQRVHGKYPLREYEWGLWGGP